mmetsp:Transcript_52159/g.163823  ORF Transcript_52159/g.163823 Transcript_52159/m.163823 type:complete len:341 (-) Transcript_52159:75-1097(-)
MSTACIALAIHRFAQDSQQRLPLGVQGAVVPHEDGQQPLLRLAACPPRPEAPSTALSGRQRARGENGEGPHARLAALLCECREPRLREASSQGRKGCGRPRAARPALERNEPQLPQRPLGLAPQAEQPPQHRILQGAPLRAGPSNTQQPLQAGKRREAGVPPQAGRCGARGTSVPGQELSHAHAAPEALGGGGRAADANGGRQGRCEVPGCSLHHIGGAPADAALHGPKRSFQTHQVWTASRSTHCGQQGGCVPPVLVALADAHRSAEGDLVQREAPAAGVRQECEALLPLPPGGGHAQRRIPRQQVHLQAPPCGTSEDTKGLPPLAVDLARGHCSVACR